MKRLICEMCGSTDLMKDGGVFVCQSCGCKYSVEEARKMMVEGTVDVRGTVQVDNSAFVQKYLENARRAKEKEDWEETEKYYNMVEQNDPNNIEAIFYSSYGKAKTSLVDGDIYKRQAVFKVLKNCISVIDDKYQIDNGEENKFAIESMAKDLSALFLSNFVFTEWKNGYGVVTRTNKNETYELFSQLLIQFRESILNIAKIDDHAYLHTSLKLTYTAILLLSDAWNQGFKDRVNSWIKEADANIENIRERRITEYWVAHPEEKTALETEKATLNNQIAELSNTINSLPESNTVKRVEDQIAALEKEKASLGLFKGKEKKAIQKQIDDLNGNLTIAKTAKENAAAPFQTEIDSLNERIKEIEDELTKDR